MVAVATGLIDVQNGQETIGDCVDIEAWLSSQGLSTLLRDGDVAVAGQGTAALLYATERPLTMDELTQRLRISKGSASQGLKLLRSFGAVRSEYVEGDRRDHYVAEVEVRNLLGGFLRERMQPHLAWGATRLNEIDQLVAALPGDNHSVLKERLVRLKRWRTRGQRLLPMVLKLLRA